MLKELDFITLIPHEESEDDYTVYLMQKKDKILLPIDIRLPYADMLSYKKIEENEFINPGIYNTMHRIFLGLDIKIKNSIFYKFADKNFYCYLEIYKNGNSIKVNASALDGIIFAKVAGCPILIKQDILNQAGIKITKKILRDALLDN